MWIYVEAPDDILLAGEINKLNRTEEVEGTLNDFETYEVRQVVHTGQGRALVEVKQGYEHYSTRD